MLNYAYISHPEFPPIKANLDQYIPQLTETSQDELVVQNIGNESFNFDFF